MDECFAERLVYSDSDTSEGEEAKTTNSSEIYAHNSTVKQSDQNTVADESDEDDLNKSIKRSKKTTRILSSDDENEGTIDGKDASEGQRPVIVRPSICDSDTNSSSDENRGDNEIPVQKFKKLRKKKEKPKKSHVSRGQSNSESDDESDENDKERHTKSNRKQEVSSSSSGSVTSDSSSHENDQEGGIQNVKPREKIIQRMSAKMAEQQMKEIQSESQRMARELHVSIPYHKPKQHSFKEFVSRRSIIQQQEKLVDKPVLKAAVAIKMSGEDLIQYMDELKKRNEEAEEFFQEQEDVETSDFNANDNDDSDFEPKNDSETIDKLGETKLNDSAENVCSTVVSPNFEILQNDNGDEGGQEGQTAENTESTRVTDVIELHTIRTELDDELDAMSTSATKKVQLSIPTGFIPKLNGDAGLIIDFETNDLKPMPKTGVDELLSRFVKNAIVKPHVTDSQDISIFRTDTGSVERHTIHVTMDDKKPIREPKPGESLFKLRTELGLKIKENREKILAQRLQEEKEKELSRKQMESGDDEFDEELSDCEKSCTEAETSIEKISEEDMEQYLNDDENVRSESEGESDDDNRSEVLDINVEINGILKTRKRILTEIDDDSDIDDFDNSCQQNPNVPSIVNGIQVNDVSQRTENVSLQISHEESLENMNFHDLSALESEILQLNSQTDADFSKKGSSKLFEASSADDEEIGESQLMALCSGSFATQNLDNYSVQDVESTQNHKSNQNQKEDSEELKPNKPTFLLSDQEEPNEGITDVNKKQSSKKKKKKHTLIYSDDEDDEENDDRQAVEVESKHGDDESDNGNEDEEDPGERYVEYDSDENEVEVSLKKKEVRKKASEYFENEAELSESEWGSDDEDEMGMNRYETELGDADKFDKSKLKDELERIRLREQIDDDARAIRILSERFIEEEDDGQERERKFRWKHLNNGDNSDDQVPVADQDDVGMQNSDDENEAEWRRIRYEREQLLKQQAADKDSFVERTATSIEITEQKKVENTTTTSILNSSKRISIVKPLSSVTPKTTHPFLIAKCDLNLGHLSRKSFLNRNSPLLEKLVSLTRTGSDNEPILNKTKGKGNYVFVATEKKNNPKRKSETEAGIMESGMTNPSKKSKMEPQKKTKIRPQTKAFFESLN